MHQLVLAAIAVAATSSGAQQNDGPFVSALRAIEAQEQRVADVAFRLLTANTELCPKVGPQTGLTLHSISQYGPRVRPTVEQLYRLGGHVGVLAVAAESPAAQAGFRRGDILLSANGEPLPLAQPRARAAYEQVAAVNGRLSSLPAQDVDLLRDGIRRTLRLRPVQACGYAFQLMPSQAYRASADGRTVFLTTGMVVFAAASDDLALILGHELAHNVLGHRARLDRRGFARWMLGNLGSSPTDLRNAERDADYAGLYLAARAGFQVQGAESFWRRFDRAAPRRGWSYSHPSRPARALEAARTATEIRRLLESGEPLRPNVGRMLLR